MQSGKPVLVHQTQKTAEMPMIEQAEPVSDMPMIEQPAEENETLESNDGSD